MSIIFNQVINFFNQDSWPISIDQERKIIRSNFKSEHGQWNCYLRLHEQEQRLIFYSILPIHVPEEKKNRVAKFLTKANYGLFLGNFEMDFEDGEVRYKVSHLFESHLSPPIIEKLIYTNVLMMDKYLQGIISIIYTKIPIEQAINQIESP